MTEILGLRKGEGRTVFYLMMYLTLQCFGTSLGIAIATSMLLAQVGADKLPYIFVGISFAALCFASIYPLLMARKRQSIHLPAIYDCWFYSNFNL